MNKNKLHADRLAEQAGNYTGFIALDAMQKCQTQGGRLSILIAALADVSGPCSGRDAALMGFAASLLGTLDKGMGLDQ